MQDIVYYVRDAQKRPLVAVTLILLGDNIARGISLYKPERAWVLTRLFGQNESLLRAAKAMEERKDLGILRNGDQDRHPVDFTRACIKALAKARNYTPDSKFSAIDLSLIEGFGVNELDLIADYDNRGINCIKHKKVLSLYRGMFNPLLTQREKALVCSHWKKYIDDIQEFVGNYTERVEKQRL